MTRRRRLSKKTQTTIITGTIFLVWLVFGSSASVLRPAEENLGILLGFLLGIFIYAAPIIYVRAKPVKVKNPKPLFVEPPAWIIVLMTFFSMLISGLLFLVFIAILSIPPFSFVFSDANQDTFLSNVIMAVIVLVSLLGPSCAYIVYIFTHYKRVVEYNTDEWKKIRARGGTYN